MRRKEGKLYSLLFPFPVRLFPRSLLCCTTLDTLYLSTSVYCEIRNLYTPTPFPTHLLDLILIILISFLFLFLPLPLLRYTHAIFPFLLPGLILVTFIPLLFLFLFLLFLPLLLLRYTDKTGKGREGQEVAICNSTHVRRICVTQV